MAYQSSLLAGKEISRDYALRRLRGRGSFGSVWEAGTCEGETVALKFLPGENRMATAQEIRAVQLVSQLYHPNLVPVYRVWCYRRYVVVTMPMADGSLLDALEAYQTEFGTPIEGPVVCDYLSQAARALDFLNTRQHYVDGRRVAVQHCDVKPSNLLLFEDTVKLADFGLATPTCSPLHFHRRGGTMDYMAPEVFQGRLSDWTDQYALAITYCQLRTGQLPFAGPPGTKVARPVPKLDMLAEKEHAVIARALAPAPQDRWPTCGDMMSRLTDLVT